MRLLIEQPPKSEFGVWSVTVALSSVERLALGDGKLIFVIPTLPQRHFRIEKNYRTASNVASGHAYDGLFSSGEWKCVFTANGTKEQDCATPISAVEAALRIAISAAMSKHSIATDDE